MGRARAAGAAGRLGDEQIAAIPGERRRGHRHGLSPAQWAALAYADAMTVHVTVPDQVFDAVRAHFGEQELLELTVTVGG